jgi:hypothetical protein
LVWAAFIPAKIKAGAEAAGDTKAVRQWAERGEVSFPAVLADGTTLAVLDDDYLSMPDGSRGRLENPVIDPTGSYWVSEIVRTR